MSVLILMYHEVTARENLAFMAKKTQYSYVLDIDRFEKQMAFLGDNAIKTLSINNLSDEFGEGSFRSKSTVNGIVLTFDDGFVGNYEYVFPALLDRGLVGNFFLITGKIGQKHMMGWEQIREMSRHGMTFGSHTVNHALIGTLNTQDMFSELEGSRKKIEDKIGERVGFLTLPHGSYRKEYKEVAISAGYKGGCTSDPGLNTGRTDSFFLKRMNVPGGASQEYFIHLCQGGKKIFLKQRVKKSLTGGAKKILGEKLYLNLYNKFFGVDS